MKRAFPPIMFYNVNDIESLVIGPSWGANLLRFPGLRTTTLSVPSYPNTEAHDFYTPTLSHINLYLLPLSIFLSYFAFKSSN